MSDMGILGLVVLGIVAVGFVVDYALLRSRLAASEDATIEAIAELHASERSHVLFMRQLMGVAPDDPDDDSDEDPDR